MKRALLLTLLLILGTTFVLTTPGAMALTATTTTVASSSNPSLLGQTVTFTATVTGGTEGSPVQISFNGNSLRSSHFITE
jgi:hypothetical protein